MYKFTQMLLGWLLLFLLSHTAAMGQATNSSGAIVGTVTDSSGAVVPDATITLQRTSLGTSLESHTNAAGQYSLTAVAPGTYTLSASANNFQKTVVSGVIVQVAKSTLNNFVLTVGAVSQSINVSATAQNQLQTTDAAVSNVIGSQEVEELPTVTRRAFELAFLQPGAQPWTGGSYNGASGTIAGASGDQNSFTLDGLDISDSQLGGECCGNIGAGIPIPVESVEEFNSSVTNQNATFARSAGGNFSFAVRHGTPQYHGAAYWYHVDDHLVANTWFRDSLGEAKPRLLDNRGGFRLSGPLLGPVLNQKLFFFLNLERRRFPNSSQVNGLVPTSTLRQGILRFPDATGAIVSYDLKSSALCGASNGSPCDPRGIGISPVIAQQYALLPAGNNSSLGDQLNTTGLSGPADSSQRNDNAVGRLDYIISQNWQTHATWAWAQNTYFNPFNNPGIDWRGGPGNIVTTASTVNRPRLYSLGLTGTLSPTLVNEFTMGFNQSTLQFVQPHPESLIPAAGVALNLPVIEDPIQINSARAQLGISRTWQFTDNVTKVANKHTLQFGFNYQYLYFLEDREGANVFNIFPVAEIGVNQNLTIPNSQRPPTCGGGITADCLLPGNVGLWNYLYASTLGLVDSVDNVVVRTPNGVALPTGTPINSAGNWHHLEYHFSDNWRLTNSLTLSLGLVGTIETPFSDNQGRQDFIVNSQTGQPIDVEKYLKQRAAAALQGSIYNPGFSWSPLSNFGGRGYFPVQNHIAPRVAAAWNPSFDSGILGRLFGRGKTVMRGGYGLGYYRALAVATAMFPQEGDQLLAQTNSLIAPVNGQGQPYRVGVDGAVPLPAPASQIPSPYTPPSNRGIGTILALDPNYKVAHMHSVDFTFQRELPGNMIAEVGYIGRFARNLETDMNLNAVPFFIGDLSHKSSQNFAQAFDQVATQLRKGVNPGNVTPQPWFENSVGPGATAGIATADASDFINAAVQNLWQNVIDPSLPNPVENPQLVGTIDISPQGWSNYNAMFASLNKRASNGLTFTLNYTLSKWNTTGEDTTDSAGGRLPVNPYNLNYGYGPAFGDRRHVISLYGVYELPFGAGHRFTGGRLRRLVDDWHWSNVVTFASGLPLYVGMGGQPFGSISYNESIPAVGPVNANEGLHHGVTGSNGVGVNSDPANGGTGLNLFANPEAVYNQFRPFLISQDTGNSAGVLRGNSRFTWDMSLSKGIQIKERLKAKIGVDFFNILNHPLFNDPYLNYLDPSSFGTITSQPGDPANGDYWTPRRIQASLRLEF